MFLRFLPAFEENIWRVLKLYYKAMSMYEEVTKIVIMKCVTLYSEIIFKSQASKKASSSSSFLMLVRQYIQLKKKKKD